MKRRALIIVLILLVLSQAPFAYRRYKLGKLSSAIRQIDSSIRNQSSDKSYREYKGVIHVHSFLGGHSSGNFAEIIEAAKNNKLDFVVMTEHPQTDFDTAAMTLSGEHAGVVFINGNEVSTREGDRLLLIPGDASANKAGGLATTEVIAAANERGALAIVAYPEEFKSWTADGYSGIEVYNVYTNARKVNAVVAFFDVLWSRRQYGDLLFANVYQRPTEALKKWDELTAGRKLSAQAGNDAHANIGVSLNDSAGKTIAGIRLDPYETSFHLVRVHLLVPKDKGLTSETIREALSSGHCFIGFDLFGATTGFNFAGMSGGEERIQGDEIKLDREVRLRVETPVVSRIVLFRNGQAYGEESNVNSKQFVVTERGVYRVEVYLPQLGQPVGSQPWIISNPIYVK